MLLQGSSYKDRWMDEEDEVHKHNVILFSKKKKGNVEMIILSEVGETDKYHVILLLDWI